MDNEKILMWDMEFKKVLGLNKAHKMVAIKVLINSMIEDKEHEIISYYETEKMMEDK